jgi:pimeloyl-ACP methyl ester carboxylesterase
MPDERLIKVTANDGVALSVADVGDGEPIVFLHEFSGNRLSWAPQVASLSRHYRCITFSARGYPPSQVPDSINMYAQDRAAADVVDVMDAIGVANANIVGLSMGGFAALHVAMRNPEKVRALVVAGCGYGAKSSEQSSFAVTVTSEADHAQDIGMAAYARELANSSYARLLRAKSEHAWREFEEQLAVHSLTGMTMTLRGVLARRPSLWDMEQQLAKVGQPTMLVIGDEDLPCLDPNLFMKRTLPDCALAIMPRTGHLPNLEEPENFNALIDRFFTSVSDGSWNQVKTLMKKKGS